MMFIFGLSGCKRESTLHTHTHTHTFVFYFFLNSFHLFYSQKSTTIIFIQLLLSSLDSFFPLLPLSVPFGVWKIFLQNDAFLPFRLHEHLFRQVLLVLIWTRSRFYFVCQIWSANSVRSSSWSQTGCWECAFNLMQLPGAWA